MMRSGYCEYNCQLCGEICPTGAIKRLPLKEKQKTQMGMAVFDKDLCIPYQRNADCLVCEEHCPLPKKAILFHVKEVTV
jgi:formate hydrogenlyase subunit 6/NADH:ubiquinone oxidoreductase subunit I